MAAPFVIGQVLTAAEMNDLAQPPQARMYRATSTFTSNTSPTPLIFNTSDYDPNSMISGLGSTSAEFTIPAGAGGLYLVILQYAVALSAQSGTVSVTQNGTTIVSRNYPAATGTITLAVEKIIQASAADTIQGLQSTSTGGLTISAGTQATYMEIIRLSK